MDNNSLLTTLRQASSFMLTISSLLIFSYCFVFYSPSAHAMVDAGKQPQQSEERELLTQITTNNRYLGQAVSALSKAVVKEKPSQKQLHHIQTYIAKRYEALVEQQQPVKDLFAKQLNLLKNSNKDKNLITSTEKQIKQISTEYQKLLDDLALLQTFKSREELSAQKTFIAQLDKKLERINRQAPIHSYDNDSLPFGPNSNEQTEALLTQEALDQKFSSKMVRTALTKTVTQDLPQEADLNANIDAQFTPALMQKAIDLDSDPVTIYNWVYNNIRYIPSHGSLQGADYTLLAGQGNATDTASLLVSLLRTSGIPARYVYGSVSLTTDQLQNWVGGVDNWEAAANLLGQGGIPVTEIINSAGQIEKIAIEHTWVEAWTDNQWVSLDPSFKQYQYSERMKLEEVVPFDATSLQEMLTNGSESNEAEGWVRGIDQEALSGQLTQYQAQLEEYMNINHPDASLAEVLGSQKIIQTEEETLPLALPYLTIHAQTSISTLPDNLRLKYRFNLLDEYGSILMSYEATGPEVAGKRHALSYKPATEADQQRLLDYLPEEINSADDLPDSLPINLISLTPEWVVEGETVKTAGNVGLGAELKIQQGFYTPGFGWKMGLTSPTNAGAYQAVGIDLQGIAPKQLQALQTELEATKAKLEAEDFDGLNKHELTGNIMQAGILLYFSMTNKYDEISSNISESITYRQPSYGTFGVSTTVSYWFGLPKNITFIGAGIDIDRLAISSEVKNNCHGSWVNLNRANSARASALEHQIPELLLNSKTGSAIEGVSAVKALSVAGEQNQKIYKLDLNRIEQLANITIDTEAKNEIRNALYQGKIVTVHEKPITHFGWTGSGYIIENPETGAGAYKISGGANGGSIKDSIFGSLAGAYSLPDSIGDWFPNSLVQKAVGIVGAIVDIIDHMIKCNDGWVIAMYALFVIGTLLLGMVIGWALAATGLGWLALGLLATLFTIIMNQVKKDIQQNMKNAGVCR